jgi:hypothetical protein
VGPAPTISTGASISRESRMRLTFLRFVSGWQCPVYVAGELEASCIGIVSDLSKAAPSRSPSFQHFQKQLFPVFDTASTQR